MILGVIGGMGPLATYNFFGKVINLTDGDKDQEHLHIIIDNNTKIPDRTEYILGDGEDPSIELVKSAIKLETMGVDYIAIPCNTAHYFYDDMSKHTNVKILNMLEETTLYLKDAYPKNTDYLLLATKGTYKSEIYKKIFQNYQLNIIEPNDSDKDTIMNWIYGVKSSKFNVIPKDFENLSNKYRKDKNIPIILGCTELSTLAEMIDLPEEEYVDPMNILAKHCVKLHEESKTNK